MRQVRLILVGGFLGAGKTTLLGRAARTFAQEGKHVGLITNDQAQDLVDTGLLKQEPFGVEEIAGGCFCCRFDDLVKAADKLLNELKPDVLLGEPVGSCTDLSATVLQPLKQLYGDWFQVAPFSVLADPARLRQSLAETNETGFPDSVLYIFRKQLEEADAIVINKADMLTATEREALRAAVAERYRQATVMVLSALRGDGVDRWLDFIAQDRPAGARIAQVDYDTYAEGEAVLGWLNGTVQLRAEGPVGWTAYVTGLVDTLRETFRRRAAEVAHLKMLLTTADGSLVVNLTSSGAEPTLRGDAGDRAAEALLVVNARVHMDPDALRAAVEEGVRRACGDEVRGEFVTLQSFSPAYPTPKHRYDRVV